MTYSDELYHHGTKGMKWGVRRYQHEDGTRTSLGKQHERALENGTKSIEVALEYVFDKLDRG